jgi:hypothetical protein
MERSENATVLNPNGLNPNNMKKVPGEDILPWNLFHVVAFNDIYQVFKSLGKSGKLYQIVDISVMIPWHRN